MKTKQTIDLSRSSKSKCTLAEPMARNCSDCAVSDCCRQASCFDESSSSSSLALDGNSDCNGCSSGRSSSIATRNSSPTGQDNDHNINCTMSDDNKKQSVSVANLVPKINEAREVVDRIRLKFLNPLDGGGKGNPTNKDEDGKDFYDSLDIEELKKPLPPINQQDQSLAFRWISRFVRFDHIFKANSPDSTEKAINEAIESLKGLLKFRKGYQIPHLTYENFPKEFFILNGVFQFGRDKQNLPIIYVRARVHRKWNPKLDDMFRRCVAWLIDSVTKSNHGAKVTDTLDSRGSLKDGSFAMCFDCLNVSYSCVDMDFLRFLVRILVEYYPTYCRYALCLDLPWLFRSVWNLVKTWLPEEARNTVHLIAAKQIVDFIDKDQLPNCIKINDLKGSEKQSKGKHKTPSNFNSLKGVEEFAEELSISSNELKQFKKHVEKVRKELEELGAI